MPPFILSFQLSALSFTVLVTSPKSASFVLNYDSFASTAFFCTVKHLKRPATQITLNDPTR